MIAEHRRGPLVLTALALVAALMVSLGTITTSSAFSARVRNSTDTAATTPFFTCVGADTAPAPANTYFVYPLADSNLTNAVDVSGNNRTGTFNNPNVFRGPTGPCTRDPQQPGSVRNGSTRLNGANNNGYVSGPNATLANPTTFTEEIWFNTTSSAGGKLIGFGNRRTGASNNYDRHIYMDATGKLWFGVYTGSAQTVTTSDTYNDGDWHHVAATLSGAGMRLYVDGELVVSRPEVTTAENYAGFWRIGWDNLNGWSGARSSDYFFGSVAYAAVYTIALTPTQIRDHYLAGS